MYTNQQGDKVSVEEMQNLAQEAGVSVEVYAKAAGYSLQSEEVTKDPEPKKATGAAQGVVAGPQIPQEITPGFMPQPVETPESTELASEDTSLDLQDSKSFDFEKIQSGYTIDNKIFIKIQAKNSSKQINF